MPLTRYVIRNEFKSTDPKLCTTNSSDKIKNDPGLLFDGVAVSGFVGLLRQLGDLALFAAEIFHDVHEQVMATAARNRGLMERIQELEADVPSIENNLLSKTDPTDFYYNAGVDWHPQMSVDENSVTQGGMPRFIRDSYEECRAPPQLFLLDKFDIGGAGACLKRFTDPSFFKVQQTTSEAGKLDIKEWIARKIKKKGSRWRNGDTPYASASSHARLHQLLLEDRTENDSKVLTHHVSVKKRNLDSSRSSKSYMQKFVQALSPEYLTAHETDIGQRLGSVDEDSIYSSPMDPERKPVTLFKYSYDFNNTQRNKDFTSRPYDGYINKELTATGENRHGSGIICSLSDDIASATEYYTDSLADAESEVETDNGYIPMMGNEYRRKKELHFNNMSKQGRDQFVDYHLPDKSYTSDDGSVSFKQETSSSLLHGVSPHEKLRAVMEHGDRKAEPFNKTFEGRDTLKNPTRPAIDGTLNVGNYATASSDVNCRFSFEEISEMSNAQKTYGSYWADAAASALLGLNLNYVGPLSTKDQYHAVADSCSGYEDTEGHVGSTNLSRGSHVGSNDLYDYSPPRNGHSSQLSISLSDHPEIGSQHSGSISPTYLGDPNSSEMNKMEEFRRPQEVSYKQCDQDMKPSDDYHGQVSESLHLDTVIEDGVLSIESESNLEGAPSLPPWALVQRTVGMPRNDSFHDSGRESGEFIIGSESDISLRNFTYGLKGSFHTIALGEDVKMPQTSDSSSHTSIHNSGRFPSPADSMPLEEDTIDSLGKHSHPTSAEVKIVPPMIHPRSVPHEAQTSDSSSHTSINSSFRFPSHTNYMPLVEDTIDSLGQQSRPSSEEVKTVYCTIHPRTILEVAQSDTLAFADETQQPCSCSPSSVTMDSGCITQFLGDVTACSKKTIQPEPAEDTVFPVRKTTQPSIASQSKEPPFEGTVYEFNDPEVSMHSTDQSSKDLKSRSKTENVSQSPEEKIIKCIEVPDPRIMTEEHSNQEIKSSERAELPNHEDENLIEKPMPAAKKLHRPRNPLIKSVDVLDRSKFKKVTPRNRLETPKVESVDATDRSKSKKVMPNADGRDSILAVIRSKSFNLKPTPAPAPKPIIRAPTMNLKVSAILEKANRIRQATAGSDEEDDWSDE